MGQGEGTKAAVVLGVKGQNGQHLAGAQGDTDVEHPDFDFVSPLLAAAFDFAQLAHNVCSPALRENVWG